MMKPHKNKQFAKRESFSRDAAPYNSDKFAKRDGSHADRDSVRHRDAKRYDPRNSAKFELHGKPAREFFRVTCDECGEKCEVPFKPTDSKPVYCRQCFKKGNNSGTDRKSSPSSDWEKINEKLDKIMRALKIQ